MKLIVVFFCLFNFAYASPFSSKRQLQRELLYEEFRNSILTGETYKSYFMTKEHQSLYVDALWDLVEESSSEAFGLLKVGVFEHFELEEKFRLGLIRLKTNGKNLPKKLIQEVEGALKLTDPSLRLIYLVASYEEELRNEKLISIIEAAQAFPAYINVSYHGLVEENQLLKDLISHQADSERATIYMFCRQTRLYPCLMIMKNKSGEIIQDETGKTWTHTALASSAKSLPSHQRNGQTPAGVWYINSVMPVADEPMSFGKFRRLILDFETTSPDEESLKKLLPLSSHTQTWWMPNVVARDVGRNEFRIHGTGKINTDPLSPFYPFMRTSGCIAQRENTYDKVEYKDQRILLDKLMESLDLDKKYQNETEIKALLYLVEIDNAERSVEIEDLISRGIL